MKRWMTFLLALALCAMPLATAEDAEDAGAAQAEAPGAEDVETAQVEAPSEEQPAFELVNEPPAEGPGAGAEAGETGETPAPEAAPTPAPTDPADARDVTQLQKWLVALSYLPADGVTGEYDAMTRAAVTAFQTDSGLTVTGECDDATWALIEALASGTASPTPAPTQSPSYSEKEIKQIQQYLVTLKYLDADGATGKLDDATAAAISRFQSEHELPATGVCDAETLKALKAQAEAAGGKGGKPSRGGGAAAPTPTPDPRLHGVTPGTALKTGHAKGSGDTSTYGAADLSEGAAGLDVSLLTGADESALEAAEYAFELDEGALTLTANDGGAVQWWMFDGMTLRELSRAGVERLTLTGGAGTLTLPTAGLFAGPAYAALRAEGQTDNTYVYIIEITGGAAKMDVYASGARYSATPAEDGAWTLNLEEET